LSIPIRENLAGVFIVLIVHSVTHCLNEAMPFSLFNATQILSIAIGKAQGINLAVVFIDLIVTPIPALFCCQKNYQLRRKNTLDFLKQVSEYNSAYSKLYFSQAFDINGLSL